MLVKTPYESLSRPHSMIYLIGTCQRFDKNFFKKVVLTERSEVSLTWISSKREFHVTWEKRVTETWTGMNSVTLDNQEHHHGWRGRNSTKYSMYFCVHFCSPLKWGRADDSFYCIECSSYISVCNPRVNTRHDTRRNPPHEEDRHYVANDCVNTRSVDTKANPEVTPPC